MPKVNQLLMIGGELSRAAIRADQRGAVSGVPSLQRHLGFITSASVTGAVFAGVAAGAYGMAARLRAVAARLRATLAVAAVLVALAIAAAIAPAITVTLPGQTLSRQR